MQQQRGHLLGWAELCVQPGDHAELSGMVMARMAVAACFAVGCVARTPTTDEASVDSDTDVVDTGRDTDTASVETDSATPEIWWEHLSTGHVHACALRSDSTVWCWGQADTSIMPDPGSVYARVSAGFDNTCTVATSGSLTCWGTIAPPPVGDHYLDVDVSDDWACALTKDTRKLVCWGESEYGRLSPPDVEVEAFSLGLAHGCLLELGTHEVHCWGDNMWGEAEPAVDQLAMVAAGGQHTCGIDGSGSAVCWGADYLNQASPPALKLEQLSTGFLHTCAITGAQRIECWGADNFGKQQSPQGQGWLQVSAGISSSSCAIHESGDIVCWGNHETLLNDAPGLP